MKTTSITFTQIFIDTLDAGMGTADRVSGKMIGVHHGDQRFELPFQQSFGDDFSMPLQLTDQEELTNLNYEELRSSMEEVFRNTFEEIVQSIKSRGPLRFSPGLFPVIGASAANTFEISTVLDASGAW